MIVTTPKTELADQRGWIKNLVLHDGQPQTTIGGVELIRSVPGAVRANHWHKTDWHYLYVLEGSILYEESENTEPKVDKDIVLFEGQMVFTPPGVWHRVTALLEATVLVSVSHLPRDHETHESDVVRP